MNLPTGKHPFRLAAITVAALGLFAPAIPFFTVLLAPPAAQAQNFGQRSVAGKVVDDRESPVSDATVFLKDLKTKSVRSFTSTDDGSFRFAQVGMVDDYEVWAEKGKLKSSVKSISSFDSRKELNFELKLR